MSYETILYDRVTLYEEEVWKLSGPGHVAGIAGSMGGILIGRAITDRPDLFVAANVAVGIVNPVGCGSSPAGECIAGSIT